MVGVNRSGIDWSNPEEVREYKRAWRKQNPRDRTEYQREWRRTHPEYHKEYKRNWRERNLEYYKEYAREWCKEHPKLKARYDRKYRQRNQKKIKIHNLMNRHPGKNPLGAECEFCGATENLEHGHLDYEDNGENYLTVCHQCNCWMDIGFKAHTVGRRN